MDPTTAGNPSFSDSEDEVKGIVGSASSTSTETYNCIDHPHWYNVEESVNCHYRSEEDGWFNCNENPCSHRYTGPPLIPDSFKSVPCTDPQIDLVGFASTLELPPSPIAEDFSLSVPLSPSPVEEELTTTLPSPVYQQVFPPALQSEEDEYIIIATAMGEGNIKETVPILSTSAQYPNWAAQMKGFLIMMGAWNIVKSAPLTMVEDAETIKLVYKAQGAILMKVDHMLHWHLKDAQGDPKSPHEM